MSVLSPGHLARLSPERLYIVLIAVIAVIALLPTAYRGVQGPFFLDSEKLTPITAHVAGNSVDVTQTQPMSPRFFGRQLGVASFVLQAQLTGGELDPSTTKWVNVAIHLLCAVLLFLLARRLARLSPWASAATVIALTTTALWTLAPANLGTAFYAVQRLAQLSSLFMIAGLIAYVALRSSPTPSLGRSAALIGAYLVSLLLAFASKENGANLLLFTLVVEFSFFGFRNPWMAPRKLGIGLVCAFFVAGLSILAIKAGTYLDYSGRPFSLIERLLTQLRVIPMYIGDLLLPAENATGLFKQVEHSRSLFHPITTLYGLIALVAYVALTVYLYRKRLALVAFGLAFFAVGHGMESSIFPLELFFLHRNYLPSFGLYLALVAGGYALGQRLGKQRLVALVAGIYLLFFGAATYARATAWSSKVEMGAAAYRYHPEGYRAASYYIHLLAKAGKRGAAFALLEEQIAANPDNDLIYRLVDLYYRCSFQRHVSDSWYEGLAEARNNARPIEVSSAFRVVVQSAYDNGSCSSVDTDRLVAALGKVAESDHSTRLPAWTVHFYRARLLRVTGQDESANQLLIELLDKGYSNAGLMLADHYLRLGKDKRAEELLSRMEKDLDLDDIKAFGIKSDRMYPDRGIIYDQK